MIVDCHVHLNNYHVDQPEPTTEIIARLRDQMAKHRLDQVLVLTSYVASQHRPSVDDLLPLLGEDPRVHLVEGVGVTGERAPDWEEIGRRLREGRTKGLKLYPGYEHVYPHDRAFRPAIDLAAKHKVPVMIHTGDTYAPRAKLKYAHPLEIDELAVDHPDVDFVMCHVGNPWLEDTAEILYKNDNVYGDISGLTLEEFEAPMEAFMRARLQNLVLYAGEPDRLLYGTDWPLVRMGPYLRFVEQLQLPEEQRALLMGGNAARLFRLPTSP